MPGPAETLLAAWEFKVCAKGSIFSTSAVKREQGAASFRRWLAFLMSASCAWLFCHSRNSPFFVSCSAETVSKFGAISGCAWKMPSPTPRRSAKVALSVNQTEESATNCRLHSCCNAKLANHVTDVKIDRSFAHVHEHRDVRRRLSLCNPR